MENEKEPSKDDKKVTLRDFIDENYKLITIMGIFIALVSLFNQKGFSGKIIAFVSLSIVIIILWELFTLLPGKWRSTYPLHIFSMLLIGGLTFSLLAYIIKEYLEFISWISILIGFTLSDFLSLKISQSKPLRKYLNVQHFGKKGVISMILFLIIWIALFYGIAFCLNWISLYVYPYI